MLQQALDITGNALVTPDHKAIIRPTLPVEDFCAHWDFFHLIVTKNTLSIIDNKYNYSTFTI